MAGFQTFGERTVHGPLLRFAQPIQLDFSMAALRFVLGNVISYRSPTLLLARLSHAKKVDGTPLSTPPSLLYCRVSRGIRRHSSPPFSLFKSKKRS